MVISSCRDSCVTYARVRPSHALACRSRAPRPGTHPHRHTKAHIHIGTPKHTSTSACSTMPSGHFTLVLLMSASAALHLNPPRARRLEMPVLHLTATSTPNDLLPPVWGCWPHPLPSPPLPSAPLRSPHSLSGDPKRMVKSSFFSSPSAKSCACHTHDLSLPSCSFREMAGDTGGGGGAGEGGEGGGRGEGLRLVGGKGERVRVCVRACVYSLTHSLTHSLSHSLTHSCLLRTTRYSLTHSLVQADHPYGGWVLATNP